MAECDSTTEVVNVAVYKFAHLTNLEERRRRLRRLCDEQRLRGTILLAEEGINLFVAGGRSSVDRLLFDLQTDPEIGELVVKESTTDYQPFRRMLVKIKKEIIAFGVDGIDPECSPAPRMSPQMLKDWFDGGRKFVLLDTRNNYEVKLGTFQGAIPAEVDHFRDFPERALGFPESWKETPVVTFCTGGIRCEKAAPYLESIGFKEVYQLDGGILKYFEEVGQDHYDGDCFVFDQRVAVNAALRETDAAQCFVCQAILTPEEQQSPHYVREVSCPYCYVAPDAQLGELLALRRHQLQEVTRQLPGSVPYDNYRPVYVPSRHAGSRLLDFLDDVVPAMGRTGWRQQIEAGRILLERRPVGLECQVAPGQCYEHHLPHVVEPDVAKDIRIVFEDGMLVVVNKPAPLPVHPCGRYNKNTLNKILALVYEPEQLRNAHRLDSNTSGLIVYSRTARIARKLQPQFARGEVEKTYLALVHGVPEENVFYSDAEISPETVAGGVRLLRQGGLASRTDFEVQTRFSDGKTLLRVFPRTGRTNQIRVHLWGLGMPIVGDPTYQLEGKVTELQSLDLNAPPMCLHAWKLKFAHPTTGGEVSFEAAPPSWSQS